MLGLFVLSVCSYACFVAALFFSMILSQSFHFSLFQHLSLNVLCLISLVTCRQSPVSASTLQSPLATGHRPQATRLSTALVMSRGSCKCYFTWRTAVDILIRFVTNILISYVGTYRRNMRILSCAVQATGDTVAANPCCSTDFNCPCTPYAAEKSDAISLYLIFQLEMVF